MLIVPDSQGGNTSKLTPDHEAMLHQVKLFSGLSSQELDILEKGKEVWFEAGDKILAEGEHETFYALLDGKVEVILRDGAKRSVLSTYESGDHFGELPIILGWSDHKCARIRHGENPPLAMGSRCVLADGLQFALTDQTDFALNGTASYDT